MPTDLVVKQHGCTPARSTNPTASTEPRYLRVQQFSAHQLHAGNGRAFSNYPKTLSRPGFYGGYTRFRILLRSLTARGGGFAID